MPRSALRTPHLKSESHGGYEEQVLGEAQGEGEGLISLNRFDIARTCRPRTHFCAGAEAGAVYVAEGAVGFPKTSRNASRRAPMIRRTWTGVVQ